MLTAAIVFYIFMCWISNWDILWPLKMLQGGLGDIIIVVIWMVFLIAGLC